jgi:hypothetical protein
MMPVIVGLFCYTTILYFINEKNIYNQTQLREIHQHTMERRIEKLERHVYDLPRRNK